MLNHDVSIWSQQISPISINILQVGVVGKYVKKDTPPEIPVTNVWSLEKNRNRSKLLRGVPGVGPQNQAQQQQLQQQQQQQQHQQQQLQQQLFGGCSPDVNSNAHIIQATNQKFGTNGKLNASGGLGHEGKYTPK